MSEPLNLLFITADQWRGECLSALGHPIVETPTLDALAADGVLFERHYANCVPCSPSRATLHTGLYLLNHRACTNGTPLDRRHTNWALELRKLGYEPQLIGYTDTTPDPRGLPPGDPTLRTYEGLLPGITPLAMWGEDPGPWADHLMRHGYELPEDTRKAVLMRPDGPDYEHGADRPKPFAVHKDHNDTAFAIDTALSYTARAKAPWALHLSLLRPHPPWIASEPYNGLYDPKDVSAPLRRPTPEEEGSIHPWLDHQLARALYRAPDNERKLRRMKAVYYGLMREVDDQLGRLFAGLKASGAWDRTFVVFTSDHGEQMGDHWLLGKCGYHEASYRVPCIVRDPRKEAEGTRGARITAFTEHVDIAPTMLAALGADIPEHLDGAPLTPFLHRKGTPARWRTDAHWEYDFRDVEDPDAEDTLGLSLDTCALNVLRGPRYKYVHFAGLPPLLFDLQEDPGEFRNLADDPAHAPRLLAFAQDLLSWRMAHADRTLTHLKVTAGGVKMRPRTATRS